jgi:hypothetical protein
LGYWAIGSISIAEFRFRIADWKKQKTKQKQKKRLKATQLIAHTLSRGLKYSSRLMPAEPKLFLIMKTGISGQSGIIMGLMIPLLL